MRLVAFALIAILSIPPSFAQSAATKQVEYFGTFLSELRGRFNLSAIPRPTLQLEIDYHYDDPNGFRWTTPTGAEVDGASIPSPFWSFIGGPFEGPYLGASVIHDHYCKTKERTEHDTHRNFYYGMRAAGVPDWKAKFMYWAVSTFGPKWSLMRRVTFEHTCANVTGQLNCTVVPRNQPEVASVNSVDLEDPEVLKVAMAKAAAVAKYLKSSNGDVLDSGTTGYTAATLDKIEESAKSYSLLFSSKDYLLTPQSLGVLAKWENEPAEMTIGWGTKGLPTYGSAKKLRNFNAQADLVGNNPFKVDKLDVNRVFGPFTF